MILAKRPRSDGPPAPCCPSPPPETVPTGRGGALSTAHRKGPLLSAPAPAPKRSTAGPLSPLGGQLLCSSQVRKARPKGKACQKMGSAHWRSSPRKSLVKGERLVRFEEKTRASTAPLPRASQDACRPSPRPHGKPGSAQRAGPRSRATPPAPLPPTLSQALCGGLEERMTPGCRAQAAEHQGDSGASRRKIAGAHSKGRLGPLTMGQHCLSV